MPTLNAYYGPEQLLVELRAELPAALTTAATAYAAADTEGLHGYLGAVVLTEIRVDDRELSRQGLPHCQVWFDESGCEVEEHLSPRTRDYICPLEVAITYTDPGADGVEPQPERSYLSGWGYARQIEIALMALILGGSITNAFAPTITAVTVERAPNTRDRWRYRARVSCRVRYRATRGASP